MRVEEEACEEGRTGASRRRKWGKGVHCWWGDIQERGGDEKDGIQKGEKASDASSESGVKKSGDLHENTGMPN